MNAIKKFILKLGERFLNHPLYCPCGKFLECRSINISNTRIYYYCEDDVIVNPQDGLFRSKYYELYSMYNKTILHNTKIVNGKFTKSLENAVPIIIPDLFLPFENGFENNVKKILNMKAFI